MTDAQHPAMLKELGAKTGASGDIEMSPDEARTLIERSKAVLSGGGLRDGGAAQQLLEALDVAMILCEGRPVAVPESALICVVPLATH